MSDTTTAENAGNDSGSAVKRGVMPLPTWGEVADAAEHRELTPTELFIYDNEPHCAEKWRAQLEAMLKEAGAEPI